LNTAAPNGEEGGDTDRNSNRNVNSNLDTSTAVNKGTGARTSTVTGTTASETNAESLSTFSRRKCVRSLFDCALFAVGSFAGTKEASANLVQFPVTYDLRNTYHIMRAGESILDQEDIMSTNPLFLTNREDALSPNGIQQVSNACAELAARDINPSVVKYSLAAKSMDTANLIASELMVGRNRLIPEYTFMDPRGVGVWDRMPLSTTEEAIWAMDVSEAGKEGKGARPPPHDDGTPNETLSEQVIKLRQLMSVLETQFSGDTIMLIFGEGTSPALLMAVMAGLPLNRVHELNLAPGEIRYDIQRVDNILNMVQDGPSSLYLEKIDRGHEQLKVMREQLEKDREEELAAAAKRIGQKPSNDDKISNNAVVKVVERERKNRKEVGSSLQKKREESHADAAAAKRAAAAERAAAAAKRVDANPTPASEVSSLDQGVSNILPLAGLGIVSFMASQSKSVGIEEKDEVVLPRDVTKGNSKGATVEVEFEGHHDSLKLLQDPKKEGVPLEAAPELQRMEDLISKAPFGIPEMSEQQDASSIPKEIFGGFDQALDDSSSSKEAKLEKAKVAMEDYLEEDDGGSDWLSLMANIVDED